MVTINISEKSAKKMLEFLEDNTDECYTSDIPYPPSNEYLEFKGALKSALSIDEPKVEYSYNWFSGIQMPEEF